jgi:hypothetical protein
MDAYEANHPTGHSSARIVHSVTEPKSGSQQQGETTSISNDGPRGWSFKTIRNGNIVKQGEGFKAKEEVVAASQRPGNPGR